MNAKDVNLASLFLLHCCNMHVKDLILAVLVAYVVLDLLLMFTAKRNHPGLFVTLQHSLYDEHVLIVFAIAIGAGFIAYWLARRSREMFTTKKPVELLA